MVERLSEQAQRINSSLIREALARSTENKGAEWVVNVLTNHLIAISNYPREDETVSDTILRSVCDLLDASKVKS